MTKAKLIRDIAVARNLKITNVLVRPQVWQDEPFEIDAPAAEPGSG